MRKRTRTSDLNLIRRNRSCPSNSRQKAATGCGRTLPPLSRNPELIGPPTNEGPLKSYSCSYSYSYSCSWVVDQATSSMPRCSSDKFFVVEVWARPLHGRE